MLDDVTAAAWLLPRMGGRFGAVTRTVPGGFAAYARILHPADRAGGTPVTWAEVARNTERQVHATAQWHAVIDADDPINPGPRNSRWPGYPPDKGALADEQLAALCTVLAAHTAAPRDCYACLWEGWAVVTTLRSASEQRRLRHRGVPPEFTDDVLSAQEAASPLVEHPGRRYRLYAGPLPEPRQFSLMNLAFPPHTASPFREKPPTSAGPATTRGASPARSTSTRPSSAERPRSSTTSWPIPNWKPGRSSRRTRSRSTATP